MNYIIFKVFAPVFVAVVFCLWFGFNEYFKANGLTFRQGVHRLFGGHGTHHAA